MAGARKAKLRYEQSPGYASFFVSDGIGGVGEDGHIILELYNEYVGQPKELAGEMISAKQGKVDTSSAPITLVREAQVRLYMTPEAATRIGQWLVGHAKEAAKVKGGQGGKHDE